MPTDEEVAAIYQKAIDALSETIAARSGVTDQQKDLAEQKQKQLSLEFVGKAIKNVEERTAKFQEFIGAMQELIDEFDPSTTVEGIKELKGLVEQGGQLVAAVLPAATAQQKAGAEPKPTMAIAAPKQPLAQAPASATKPATGAKAKAKKAPAPSTAKASKAGKPAAKAPAAATTKAGSKAKATAAPKKPTAKKPAAKKPARKPAAKKPATKKSAVKKPAPKRAAVQKKPARKARTPG